MPLVHMSLRLRNACCLLSRPTDTRWRALVRVEFCERRGCSIITTCSWSRLPSRNQSAIVVAKNVPTLKRVDLNDESMSIMHQGKEEINEDSGEWTGRDIIHSARTVQRPLTC